MTERPAPVRIIHVGLGRWGQNWARKVIPKVTDVEAEENDLLLLTRHVDAGGGLAGQEAVDGVQIEPDRRELWITTREPREIFATLPALSRSAGVMIREFGLEDESLDAVLFGFKRQMLPARYGHRCVLIDPQPKRAEMPFRADDPALKNRDVND